MNPLFDAYCIKVFFQDFPLFLPTITKPKQSNQMNDKFGTIFALNITDKLFEDCVYA